MAAEEKILIDVQIKNADAEKRIAQIGLLTDELSKANKGLKKSYDDGLISQDKYTSGVAKNASAIKLLKQEKSALETSVKNEIKNATSLEGSYDKLSSQYNLNKQKLNDMSLAQRANTEEGKKLEKETFAIYQEMIKLQEATGKHVLSVGDYTKVVGPLVDALKKENVVLAQNNQELEEQKRTIIGFNQAGQEQEDQIKAINNQIGFNNQKMQDNSTIIKQSTNNIQDLTNVTKVESNTIAGMNQRLAELQKTLQTTDLGSKQFKDANEEAQKLKLKIDQTLGKVNEFGDKEPKNLTKKAFSDTAEAGAGLVSIVSLANVVLGENEKASEVQAATLKAVAVSQLAMNAAKGVGAIIDVKDLIVKGAQTTATWALTAAQTAYTLIVGKSTGAMKAFKIALAGTGIGAVVILLAELIFNFDTVSKKIDQAKNAITDWTAKISGNNKAIKSLVDVLLTVGSPLVFIIGLINDFSGTLTKLQNSVNSLVDDVASKMGIFGDALKAGFAPFNFIIGAVKSLDSGAKKYKPTIETLTKTYENFNDAAERKRKGMQKEIDLAKAQGASEGTLANMQKKLLKEVSIEQQKALDFAIKIKNKLIQQNGKLTDEQQKLFDQVQDANDQAILDEKVFQQELNKTRSDAYKERLELERNLQHELQVLRNQFIKDEFDKQRADLDEQFRFDKEANELEIKAAVKKYGEKSEIVADLREKDTLLTQKYNDDSFAIDVAQADKEADALMKSNEMKAQIIKDGLEAKLTALQTQEEQELAFLEASFVNTGKTEQQKLNQQIDFNNQKLAIELKFLQDKLALAKQFALEDGIITDQEAQDINAIATAIAGVQEQIKQGENAKVVDGLGLTPKDVETIELAANSILSILNTIKSVVDANAANQIRNIDDTYKYEEKAILQSTDSQEEKEEKIQALNKKTAEKKYQIELEQFETNKAISIVNTIITTAQAVMAALANPTPFAGPILAAIAAATGAAQLGIIASQPPPPKPQFATGVIGLDGPGTGTSDSIDARLSKGESVMTAKATSIFHRELAAMELAVGNNPNYNFAGGHFAAGVIGDGGFSSRGISDSVSASISSDMLVNGLSAALKNIKVVTKVTDINKVQGEVVKNRIAASI